MKTYNKPVYYKALQGFQTEDYSWFRSRDTLRVEVALPATTILEMVVYLT